MPKGLDAGDTSPRPWGDLEKGLDRAPPFLEIKGSSSTVVLLERCLDPGNCVVLSLSPHASFCIVCSGLVRSTHGRAVYAADTGGREPCRPCRIIYPRSRTVHSCHSIHPVLEPWKCAMAREHLKIPPTQIESCSKLQCQHDHALSSSPQCQNTARFSRWSVEAQHSPRGPLASPPRLSAKLLVEQDSDVVSSLQREPCSPPRSVRFDRRPLAHS